MFDHSLIIFRLHCILIYSKDKHYSDTGYKRQKRNTKKQNKYVFSLLEKQSTSGEIR